MWKNSSCYNINTFKSWLTTQTYFCCWCSSVGSGNVLLNYLCRNRIDKSLQLLAIHALTGCDTTSYLFGKGKASAVSIMLKHDMNLEVLGQTDANLCDVISAGHRCFSILYSGKQSTTTMNLLRHTIFISKRDTPKIKTLPPLPLMNISREHICKP